MHNTTYPFFKYWDIAEFARLQGAVESYQKENRILKEKIKQLEKVIKEKTEELKIEEAISRTLNHELITLKKAYAVKENNKAYNKDISKNKQTTKDNHKIIIDSNQLEDLINRKINENLNKRQAEGQKKFEEDTKINWDKFKEDMKNMEDILDGFDNNWDVSKWGC